MKKYKLVGIGSIIGFLFQSVENICLLENFKIPGIDMHIFSIIGNFIDGAMTILVIIALIVLGNQLCAKRINLYTVLAVSISWWPLWAFIKTIYVKQINLVLNVGISSFAGIITMVIIVFLFKDSGKVAISRI
ncbi:MAG: hypothetical protein PF637_08515 [Spirochaetes bacterium]|jgi:hypothetical protein|nr:hypothetical protein [Spirochaetota bacterium]